MPSGGTSILSLMTGRRAVMWWICAVLLGLSLVLAGCGAKSSAGTAKEEAPAAGEELEMLDQNIAYEAVIEVKDYGTIVFTQRRIRTEH